MSVHEVTFTGHATIPAGLELYDDVTVIVVGTVDFVGQKASKSKGLVDMVRVAVDEVVVVSGPEAANLRERAAAAAQRRDGDVVLNIFPDE